MVYTEIDQGCLDVMLPGKPNQNFPLKITFGVLMKYLNQRIK